jgi:hypothetical protein
MNAIAESYVKLVLAVGQHDANYVDAYYGPPEWKTSADSAKLSLDEILRRADGAIAQLGPAPLGNDLPALRNRYLRTQLGSLRARVRMLQGQRFTFDEESKALYDAVAPTHDDAHFQRVIDTLSRLLPGRDISGCLPVSALPWSLSSTSRGADTTGIRATTGRSSR